MFATSISIQKILYTCTSLYRIYEKRIKGPQLQHRQIFNNTETRPIMEATE